MEIVSGVHSMGNSMGGRVRAFLLDDGHDLTLVDTCFEPDARLVLAEIQRIGRTPADLKRIVLCHGHRAHLGGLAALKRLTGARVYAHEWEVGIIEGKRQPPRISWLPAPPWRAYPLQLGFNLRLDNHAPCPVDEVLIDGKQVGPLVTVHTPGHTPGHCSFYWHERRVMMTGDIVATWPRLEPGWRAFHSDLTANRASVRKMVEFKPEALCVGHGDPVRNIGHERLMALVEEAERWIR